MEKTETLSFCRNWLIKLKKVPCVVLAKRRQILYLQPLNISEMNMKIIYTRKNVQPELVKHFLHLQSMINVSDVLFVQKKCPVEAIEGKVKIKHVIDQDKCIKCGKCEETCKFGAIER